MDNLLKKICDDKKKEIIENKKKCSYKTLEKLLPSNETKRNFKNPPKRVMFARTYTHTGRG